MDSKSLNKNIPFSTESVENCKNFFLPEFIIKEKDISIDGSILEGGGQILRISLAFSVIFNKNLKIYNIRGNRNPPGLKNQHLACVNSLALIFKSEVIGAYLGSKEIKFIPTTEINSEDLNLENIICDSGSAGSIGLMIQQILPCLFFTNKKFDKISMILKGGTIVNFSPPTFYLKDVLGKILSENMNIHFELNVERHGVFPVGGGVVNFEFSRYKDLNFLNYEKLDKNEIIPKINCENSENFKIKNINILSRKNLVKILLRVVYTKNIESFNQELYLKSILKEIKKILIKNLDKNFSFIKKFEENLSEEEISEILKNNLEIKTEFIELPGFKKSFTIFTNVNLFYENSVITIEKLFSEKKQPSVLQRQKNEKEFISEIENILENEKICFDEYTVDHLIIFMALAKGKSSISVGEISLHTKTAVEIVKRFIPDLFVEIINIDKNTNIIEIEGIGN